MHVSSPKSNTTEFSLPLQVGVNTRFYLSKCLMIELFFGTTHVHCYCFTSMFLFTLIGQYSFVIDVYLQVNIKDHINKIHICQNYLLSDLKDCHIFTSHLVSLLYCFCFIYQLWC